MENEACSICLDQLFGSCPEITRIQPCGHYYHPECIQLWRERSNQCPTCRRDYVLMEAVTQQGHVTASEVADRVVLPPPEEEFFEALNSEEDPLVASNVYARLELRIERQVAHSNGCALCDSYNGAVVSCNSCSTTFHGQCLGLGQERIAQWYCPMCGAEQGTFQPPSQFRRSRFSERTNRVYNTLMASSSARDEPAMTEFVVERPQLSPEEQLSWESFEAARREGQQQASFSSSSSSGMLPPALPQGQRRQKRPSRSRRVPTDSSFVPRGSSTFSIPQASPAGPSLINTLLGQMKELKHTERPLRNPEVLEPVPTRFQHSNSTSMSSQSSSPVVSPSIPTSPESPSSPTNKTAWKMNAASGALSLTQKSGLRDIVTSKLKPLYKDGILNEDQYTQINMKVSRILYDACLKELDSMPDFEAMAQWYVEKELEVMKRA